MSTKSLLAQVATFDVPNEDIQGSNAPTPIVTIEPSKKFWVLIYLW